MAKITQYFENLKINGSLSATTISATTFWGDGTHITGLPYVTGGTYSTGTTTFTNSTGGTFDVTGYTTGNIDVYVTGGTTDNSGTAIFTNNTGGTFNVTGFSTVYTDVYSTGMTLDPFTYDLTITRNDGNTFYTNLALLATDMTITGGTYDPNTGVVTFTNNTGGTFSVSGFSTGITDTVVTSLVYSGSNNTIKLTDSTGGTFTAVIDTMSGLTINGDLTVTGTTTTGILSAITISATTYYGDGSNLTGISTQDTFVTGATTDNDAKTYTFTNNTGGTFTVTGLTDIYVTGGTVSNSGQTVTFTNITGGTFDVTGLTPDNFSLYYPITGGTVYGSAIITGDVLILGSTTIMGTATTIDTHIVNVSANTITLNSNVTGGTPVLNAYINVSRGSADTATIVWDELTDQWEIGLSGNTYPILTTSGGTLTGDLIVPNLTATTISASSITATTYYGNGSNLTGIPDIYVTGATTDNNNKTYTFTYNSGGTFTVTGLTDIYVTGGTYSAGTITLVNTTGGTFDVTGLSTTIDTYVTGFTYLDNVFTIQQNQGQPDLIALIDTVTGLTVNGDLTVTGDTVVQGLTATTISATTYLNSPIDVYVTGGTYTAGTATFTNITGGTFDVTGFSPTSTFALTTGVTANTTYTVMHNLNTSDFLVQIIDLSDNELVELTVDNYQVNSVDVTSTADLNIRVIILAIGGMAGGGGSPSPNRYTLTTGLTANVSVTVPHNLDNLDVIVQVKDLTANDLISVDVSSYTLNTVDITSTIGVTSARIIVL